MLGRTVRGAGLINEFKSFLDNLKLKISKFSFNLFKLFVVVNTILFCSI